MGVSSLQDGDEYDGDGLLAVAPGRVHRFNSDEQRRWRANAHTLLDQATWEAARGFEMTDQIRWTIAANAAVLTAGFEPTQFPFENVAAIVVHPQTIVQPERRGADGNGGIATSGPLHAAGLALGQRGPVVLDWRTIQWEQRSPNGLHNVVYHEFAHKLDFLNGHADGMPPLPVDARDEWIQTIGTNYRRLRRRGTDGLIRNYGATNPAEYFAVLTEVFFCQPDELRARLPRVYERLANFYRQQPTDRVGDGSR